MDNDGSEANGSMVEHKIVKKEIDRNVNRMGEVVT